MKTGGYPTDYHIPIDLDVLIMQTDPLNGENPFIYVSVAIGWLPWFRLVKGHVLGPLIGLEKENIFITN